MLQVKERLVEVDGSRVGFGIAELEAKRVTVSIDRRDLVFNFYFWILYPAQACERLRGGSVV